MCCILLLLIFLLLILVCDISTLVYKLFEFSNFLQKNVLVPTSSSWNAPQTLGSGPHFYSDLSCLWTTRSVLLQQACHFRLLSDYNERQSSLHCRKGDEKRAYAASLDNSCWYAQTEGSALRLTRLNVEKRGNAGHFSPALFWGERMTSSLYLRIHFFPYLPWMSVPRLFYSVQGIDDQFCLRW